MAAPMAEATATTCYHRVGDGDIAPRRRRRVRICALLCALALGWCLLSTADKVGGASTDDDDLWTQPQEPQQHGLREVRAVRGWLNHTLTVEAGVWHLPHGISFIQDDLTMASLDHGMWFHRPVRVDEWLLYSTDSPSSSGGRGLARGLIYDRDGRLVASTIQEGMMRVKGKRKKGTDND